MASLTRIDSAHFLLTSGLLLVIHCLENEGWAPEAQLNDWKTAKAIIEGRKDLTPRELVFLQRVAFDAFFYFEGTGDFPAFAENIETLAGLLICSRLTTKQAKACFTDILKTCPM